MKVKVLQHHIDQGERRKHDNCPIVHAIREQYPDARGVSMNAYIEMDGQIWIPPDNVREFVRNYDNDLPVEPFEFDLPEK